MFERIIAFAASLIRTRTPSAKTKIQKLKAVVSFVSSPEQGTEVRVMQPNFQISLRWPWKCVLMLRFKSECD